MPASASMSTPTAQPVPQKLVWWILWFAFLQGVFIYRLFLVPKAVPGQPLPPDVIPWGVALLPVLASGVLRWNVLPRLRERSHGLFCLIGGVALAEVTCLLAIFLARSHLDLLFAASVLGVLQWAPLYAERFFAPPGGGH
jgi:hypothetical protein